MVARSRQKAALDGGESLRFNPADGSIVVKESLDRSKERNISFPEWNIAARIAERKTAEHQSSGRAASLASHHDRVRDLTVTYTWPVALEYDIRQREIWAMNPTHDIGQLNANLLLMCATQLTITSGSHLSSPSYPPNVLRAYMETTPTRRRGSVPRPTPFPSPPFAAFAVAPTAIFPDPAPLPRPLPTGLSSTLLVHPQGAVTPRLRLPLVDVVLSCKRRRRFSFSSLVATCPIALCAVPPGAERPRQANLTITSDSPDLVTVGQEQRSVARHSRRKRDTYADFAELKRGRPMQGIRSRRREWVIP
ncbi:hypothetical protein NMY22_g16661 [Coprinellus aureogranulatus]|nr:hypothetical protein NMY22_g16661 [Coprinellus aureogranulatus]